MRAVLRCSAFHALSSVWMFLFPVLQNLRVIVHLIARSPYIPPPPSPCSHRPLNVRSRSFSLVVASLPRPIQRFLVPSALPKKLKEIGESRVLALLFAPRNYLDHYFHVALGYFSVLECTTFRISRLTYLLLYHCRAHRRATTMRPDLSYALSHARRCTIEGLLKPHFNISDVLCARHMKAHRSPDKRLVQICVGHSRRTWLAALSQAALEAQRFRYRLLVMYAALSSNYENPPRSLLLYCFSFGVPPSKTCARFLPVIAIRQTTNTNSSRRTP